MLTAFFQKCFSIPECTALSYDGSSLERKVATYLISFFLRLWKCTPQASLDKNALPLFEMLQYNVSTSISHRAAELLKD
jgi:hypothetical protein